MGMTTRLGRFFGLGGPTDVGGPVAILQGLELGRRKRSRRTGRGLGQPDDDGVGSRGQEALEGALIAAGHAKRALEVNMGCAVIRQMLDLAATRRGEAQRLLAQAGPMKEYDRQLVEEQIARLEAQLPALERSYQEACQGVRPAAEAGPRVRMERPAAPQQGGMDPAGAAAHFEYEVEHHAPRMQQQIDQVGTLLEGADCAGALRSLTSAAGALGTLEMMSNQSAQMLPPHQHQTLFPTGTWRRNLMLADNQFAEVCLRSDPEAGGGGERTFDLPQPPRGGGMAAAFGAEVAFNARRLKEATARVHSFMDRGDCRNALRNLNASAGALDSLLTMTQGGYMLPPQVSAALFDEGGWNAAFNDARGAVEQRCVKSAPSTGDGGGNGGGGGGGGWKSPLLEF